MDLDSLPTLVQSDNGPILRPTKQIPEYNLNLSYFKVEPSQESCVQSRNESNYNFDSTEECRKSRLSTKFRDSSLLNYEKTESFESEIANNVNENMASSFFSECRLKRFQSCFAVVRKDTSFTSRNEGFEFGSSSTLPGVVELDDCYVEQIHRKQGFGNQLSRFWNASFQLSHSKQHVKFVEYCHHFLVQLRKFIIKLRRAIKDETLYLEHMNQLKLNLLSSKSNEENTNQYGDGNYSNFSSKTKNLFSKETFQHPMKSEKLHAELKMHFQTWSDILENWNASRLEMDSRKFRYMNGIHKKIKRLNAEILVLVEELITCRLRHFSSFVSFRSQTDGDNDKEWDFMLGRGCAKHLSKLIESYNKLLSQHRETFSQRFSMTFQNKLSSSSQSFFHNKTESSALNVFDVTRILTILAEPAKHELASSLLNILSVVQNPSENQFSSYEQNMLGRNPFNYYQFDWSAASHFEIDEDHVILRVAGFEVYNISSSTLSEEALSSIKLLLYGQGSFIVWFMNCLAANTSLLRNNIQSRDQRSVLSSQAFTEDTSVVSSDDEASSVASSLIFGQLGSSSGTHKRQKTVLWRDSWDQEAVKSSSKSYVASIITEGPVQTLLTRAVDLSLSYTSSNAAAFRPRFWQDEKALITDASVMNMLTMEVLPDDLLEKLQESTQAFIVEKALERWDSLMCLALGTSLNDKCGSLPIDGYPTITKTAWIYIKALRTLMFITERFSKREDVIENTFPRLQATLDAFHRWCHIKIQQFVANWRLRELMQVTLGDLSQVTQLALKCLPLIEKCHNFVESKRAQLPGTLQLATIHLRNIDLIITNMQSLSGHCVKSYTKKCAHLSKTNIEDKFPSPKLWRQKNLTDHTAASHYMEELVETVLVPICSAVSALRPRSQLATVSPAVRTIYDAVIRLILDRNISFSIQGTLQLQRDFERVIDYVCSDEARLCDEVRRAAPKFNSFTQACWVVNTLQRTDPQVSSAPTRTGYERSRRRVHARGVAHEDMIGGSDDNDWTLKEKEFLALRAHVRSKRKARKCFAFPC